MAFRFKLEKVLHFIRMRESVKKMEVATILQRIGFLERRRLDVEAGIRACLETSQRAIEMGWASYQNAKITLDVKETARLDRLLVEERSMLKKRKDQLSRLLMRKKALESLREKRQGDYRLEENRRRQKELDEIHQLRAVQPSRR